MIGKVMIMMNINIIKATSLIFVTMIIRESNSQAVTKKRKQSRNTVEIQTEQLVLRL